MLIQLSCQAAVISDPSRARMLERLMDGRSYTASELAKAAGVVPGTASTHLARLEQAGLIVVTPQGRHRYIRLAGPEVGVWLETLALVPASLPSTSCPPPLRFARVCYTHLAGTLSLKVAGALLERGWLIQQEQWFKMAGTDGNPWTDLGVEPSLGLMGRPCMDWSERHPHIGGPLGSALLKAWFDRGWLERVAGSRALGLTYKGASGLKGHLGLSFD